MRDYTGEEGGACLVLGEARFDRCVFETNISGDDLSCEPVKGGAVSIRSADATFQACEFVGNSASHPACSGTGHALGGALYVLDSNVEIRQSIFRGNTADGVDSARGGAISARDSPLVLDGKVIRSNVARGDFTGGGGIRLLESSAQLSRVDFIENVAGRFYAGTASGG